MPQPKTRKKSASLRVVKTPQPRRQAKRSSGPTRAPARPSVVRRRVRAGDDQKLPGWGELASGNGKDFVRHSGSGAFAAVPTLRLVLMIVAIAAIVTLYVGHVYATSSLLTEVDSLRKDNLELHLELNQVKGTFDRASGPAVIAARAHAIGLIEQVPGGTPIVTDHPRP